MSARAIMSRCAMPPEYRFHFLVLAVAQPEFIQKLAGASFALLARDAVIGGMKGENLAHFEAAIEIALLRHYRDAPLRLDRIASDVDAHERR